MAEIIKVPSKCVNRQDEGLLAGSRSAYRQRFLLKGPDEGGETMPSAVFRGPPRAVQPTSLSVSLHVRKNSPGTLCIAQVSGDRSPFIRSRPHSHSIVAGGLLVTSRTTRLTPSTSLQIRLETRSRSSGGRRTQSAVMPSWEWTARRTTASA